MRDSPRQIQYGEGTGIAALTTITIHLTDHQAAALAAKATAQGLTLEEWFQQLAAQDTPASVTPPQTVQEAIDRILEVRKRVKPDPEGWTVRDYIEYGRQ